MGLRLFFLPNFSGATFIQGGMFIPDSRVVGCPARQVELWELTLPKVAIMILSKNLTKFDLLNFQTSKTSLTSFQNLQTF